MRIRFTDEQLIEAVASNVSIAGVMRHLGYTLLAGGSHLHVSKRIKQAKLDTRHFTGQAWFRGQTSKRKKCASDILIYDPEQVYRQRASQLRRALLESDVEEKCSICGIKDWNNEPLVLEIDHIDGDYRNNKLDNLRFLCPNCHSQKPTNGA